MNKIKLTFICLLILSAYSIQAEKLRVGVSLHPYYSWVKNIVKDKADIFPLIETGNNVHNYQPRPADVERVMKMDVLVVNGVGHDEFAFAILKAKHLLIKSYH